MGQFDKYSAVDYVNSLHVFLQKMGASFFVDNEILSDEHTKNRVQNHRYTEDAVNKLENEVNLEAERAEAIDTTLGERIRIAAAYKGFSSAEVAKLMGVSRELVQFWVEDIRHPGHSQALAQILDVPTAWLDLGGEQHLPANSHIGVRVGQESLKYRKNLYAKTLELIPKISEFADMEYAQAFIEQQVFSDQVLTQIARKTGGRWHILNGHLVFSPWAPTESHQKNHRNWSDKLEAMIEEELSSKPSAYGAWNSLKARCTAIGLTKEQLPNKITLHRRLEIKQHQN